MQACAGFVKWKYGEIRALKLLLVGERIDFAKKKLASDGLKKWTCLKFAVKSCRRKANITQKIFRTRRLSQLILKEPTIF